MSAALDDERAGVVRIRVSDEGPGIPESVRPHLFQPFFTTKQDLGSAIGPSTIAALLGAPEGVSMVGASAAEGIGVRETLVLAIRRAADAVQKRVLGDGLGEIEGPAQTPEALLEEMLGRHPHRDPVAVALFGQRRCEAAVPPDVDDLLE